MLEDNIFWNYKKEPGKELKEKNYSTNEFHPLISIITSYYNSSEFMMQTINSVLNQTFPYWEWIIVDDGSTNKKDKEFLREVSEIDSRIKVFYKNNEGLAKGRDFAIQKSNSNYILPLDADDLIEETYIETLYWALETNHNATWAFTNSVGFGEQFYLADKVFDSEKMKVDNMITVTSLIKKQKIIELGGYGMAERYINEDWHLWLRMLAKGYYPIQLSYYGFWYRRRKQSLLSDINDPNKKENELRIKALKKEADKIKNKVDAIIYPNYIPEVLEYNKLNWNKVISNYPGTVFILPYLGTDKKIYKKIFKESKNKKVYIITIEKSPYIYRQKYERFSVVYDLTTILDSKFWLGFIEYIINSKTIDKIYMANNKYEEQIGRFFKINEILKYKDNKILYYISILKYKLLNTLPMRIIKRIIKKGCRK